MAKKAQTVRILNPEPDGRFITSRRAAQNYVNRGMAVWEKGAIRFTARGLAIRRPEIDMIAHGRFFRWAKGESAGYKVMKATQH